MNKMNEMDEMNYYEFNASNDIDLTWQEYKNLCEYADNNNVSVEVALKYMSKCHCCGKYMEESTNVYCSDRCFVAIDEEGHSCEPTIYGDKCDLCIARRASGRGDDRYRDCNEIKIPEFHKGWVNFNKKNLIIVGKTAWPATTEMLLFADDYKFTQKDYDEKYRYGFDTFQKMEIYAEMTNIELLDTRIYMSSCHCCNENISHASDESDASDASDVQMYCSDRCKRAIEHQGCKCYWIENTYQCKICKNVKHEGVPEFLQEMTEFNATEGTYFLPSAFAKVKFYAADTGLQLTDAVEYSQKCHCCDIDIPVFGNLYCSERCRQAIEDDGHECVRKACFKECLVCNLSGREYDENSVAPPFVELPTTPCMVCYKAFAYPAFEYKETYYFDPAENLRVCHGCFCEHSRARHNTPVVDHPCNHPALYVISAFKELGIYNFVVDMQVWEDLSHF